MFPLRFQIGFCECNIINLENRKTTLELQFRFELALGHQIYVYSKIMSSESEYHVIRIQKMSLESQEDINGTPHEISLESPQTIPINSKTNPVTVHLPPPKFVAGRKCPQVPVVNLHHI